MAWDEWEQLKADALQSQQGYARMQLNQVDGGVPPKPSSYGDLRVANDGLTKIGTAAFDLYNDL
jgi:hypothetical protein